MNSPLKHQILLSDTQRDELEQMALIVPLIEDEFQSGALVLGNKLSGADFATTDLEYLESAAHQLALMMESARQQQARAL